ncbi:uncharacterized [Tachysurus ichikawai]
MAHYVLADGCRKLLLKSVPSVFNSAREKRAGGGAWRMRSAHADHTQLSRDVLYASTMQYYTNTTPAGRRRASSQSYCKHCARPCLTLWIKAVLFFPNMG